MSSMSNSAHDAASEIKGAARDTGNAAAVASGDIRDDLAALRDEVARLARQLAETMSSRGSATWRSARSSVEDAIAGVQDKGSEAVDAVREVGDNMVDALDESLKRRPYTTLAIAAGIGFLIGATWRR
jgi:ElaB/YqjD/DUF883 family membrane-anchored ribosome-binding protein